MKQEWPALLWLTKEEKRRRQEEENVREQLEDEEGNLAEPFDANQMCGHRYASQLLPDEWDEEYLAWSIAERDVVRYYWILEHLDIVELIECYAMKRTDLYLDSEETDK